MDKSRIQGQGLFATQPIEAGEMVIEYAGEVIRRVSVCVFVLGVRMCVSTPTMCVCVWGVRAFVSIRIDVCACVLG